MKIFLIVNRRINRLFINGTNISHQDKLKHCQNLTKLFRQFPFDLGNPLFRTRITVVLAKIKNNNNHTHIQIDRHAYRQKRCTTVAKEVEPGIVAHLSPQQSGGYDKRAEFKPEDTLRSCLKKQKWK